MLPSVVFFDPRMRPKFFIIAIFFVILVAFAGKQRHDDEDADVDRGFGERGTRHPSGPRPEPLPVREAKSLKRKIFEPLENIRSWAKRARHFSSEEKTDVETRFIPGNSVEELDELERKWHAVLDLSVLQALGTATNEKLDEIGTKYDVGTGRNVRYLLEKLRERGTLRRKEGSGRPACVTNRVDVIEFFERQAEEWGYSYTFEAMIGALKNEFDVGSPETVKRLRELLEHTKHRRQVRPLLTPEHMEARKEWAQEWKGFDFFDTETVVLHLDEKQFFAFSARGKIVYLPPGVDPKPFFALSKTQIPHVMFLGVVGAPRPEMNFDGKIGLYHVGEEYIAKRASKYHEHGEVYMIDVNMDGDLFMKIVTENVIPDIRKKLKWAKEVIVQIDSAGGHRVKESLDALNVVGARGKLPIRFITQPTRSPDTNVLDLGIWRSMQSRVVEVKYSSESDKKMAHRIVDAVEVMWREYDPVILNNIFITLPAILEEIYKNEGGNSYKIPHLIKDPEC
jgi:transposase